MSAPRRLSFALRLVTTLLVLAGTARASAEEINWTEVEQQASEFLSAYIQVDTSNPPGNETAAAQFLAQRFRAAGIDAEVFESQPGRGSVLARLKGKGGKRPIILLNHLDVVPATPEGWTVAPFSGAVRDGFVNGRGALDCKGVGVVDALALLLIKAKGIGLQRDVIFLGTADEEAGGKLGAGWMVANHFDKFSDAEFVLNEGGHIRVLPNGKRAYEVAVSEKTPCWLRLTATGDAGHGSAPPKETAVTRLLHALDRIQALKPKLRVTPEVAAYYAAQAEIRDDKRRAHYEDLRTALADKTFRDEFLADRHDAALVRNTITPTVLTASQKINVIPRNASAELDCRLLPGEDPDVFVRSIKEAIKDPEVSVDVLLNFPPSSSTTDTVLFGVLRTLAQRDGAPIVPAVLTGFTDSHYFRDKGIASYGFVPFVLSEEDERGEHGINERLSTENLRTGVLRLLSLLQTLDGEVQPDASHDAHQH